MKKTFLFNSRRFPVPHFAGKAYKSDGRKTPLTPAEQKAINDKLLAEKNARIDNIKAAQKAFDEFALDGPDAVEKKFALQLALLEAKAADSEKNQEEKMEAINKKIAQVERDY